MRRALVCAILPLRRTADTLRPQAWTALATTAGEGAYEAGWNLVAAGDNAVAFLKQQLKPAAPFPDKNLAKLLADLDSKQFKERTAAVTELRKLGPLVEVELRQ